MQGIFFVGVVGMWEVEVVEVEIITIRTVL